MRRAARYVAVYVGWLLSSALGLYVMLKAWEAVRAAYVALRLDKWGYGAASHFSILILGLVWLVGILFVEAYYRTGAEQHDLRRRFLRVALIELAVLAPTFLVLFLAS